MPTGSAWDESEVERTLDAYLAMLRLELIGEPFSKVDFYRPLSGDIGRSESAVQYKFNNVSAVLAEMGSVFVDGYKPLVNVQGLLRDKVADRFAQEPELRQLMIRLAEKPPDRGDHTLGDPEPVPLDLVPPSRQAQRERTAVTVDFNALESANRSRGLAGELLVVERERRVLGLLGRRDLAERVRHTSVEDGDGMGYDVRSFTSDGRERFLEVKTTVRSALQPFYVSANEVEFSTEVPDQFSLVRVFHLDRRPGFYEMPGSLRTTAELRPDSYVAWPRPRAAG
ncbi:DUF3883 domain-containing protein [Phycicoccus sp. CSK15P-2]|uniref:DUF3883 domain-containing protein n=1 Tax=Phycicoccus sp. CSK15P-2 TaxID=2807627 RepID=UPI0019525ED1|nr:DUF3883 domain-containing protein [Phycicoccus sp. CSK15P-2]MBM6404619.1 DUF3883 domain-containing protein [Phycicoccus sp. CSK15P-2]